MGKAIQQEQQDESSIPRAYFMLVLALIGIAVAFYVPMRSITTNRCGCPHPLD